MLKKVSNQLRLISILALGLWLVGCATTTAPIRHLSSDVCLVLPESTTKTEVLAFLGEPDQKTVTDGSTETWIYYKKNEDLIRKLPLVGEKFGSLNYERVTVSFVGNLVRTCVYRQLEPGDITGSPDAPMTTLPE
jgi:hypothetical protein